MKNYFLFAFILIFLVACGAGSGEGLDETGNLPGDDPPLGNDGGNSEGVSLNDLVNTIFNNNALGSQRCANCHSGGSPFGGMNLETVELAYANLVGSSGQGVTANGNARFKRVSPGNPDESYIILKLEGDARAGSQMPLGETPLSQAQINMVRDWIANGAQEMDAGSSPTVVTNITVPKNNELKIHFSRALSSQQNIEDSLEINFQNSTSNWLASPSEVDVSVSGQDLYLNFAFVDEVPDGYTLKINSPQLGVIYDERGVAIDGNSDKQEGGVFNYEYQF